MVGKSACKQSRRRGAGGSGIGGGAGPLQKGPPPAKEIHHLRGDWRRSGSVSYLRTVFPSIAGPDGERADVKDQGPDLVCKEGIGHPGEEGGEGCSRPPICSLSLQPKGGVLILILTLPTHPRA